jgi:hypothetical protein
MINLYMADCYVLSFRLIVFYSNCTLFEGNEMGVLVNSATRNTMLANGGFLNHYFLCQMLYVDV